MNKNLTKLLYIFFILTIIFTAFVRIRMLSTPFERDEGEYAYAGQLILQGIPPYSLACNMKLPGIYAVYAAMLAVFGQTIEGVHLGLMIVNLVTIFIFFLLCKKIFNPVIAVVSSAIYAILGLGENILGFTANAEPFVMIFVVPAILLLIYALEKQKYRLIFASAVLFGISFLMKQHAAAFILFGGLWLLIETIKSKPFSIKRILLSCSVFTVGVFLPYIATCLLMWKLGVFKNFWFWTFEYAQKYVTQVTFADFIKMLPFVFGKIIPEITKPILPVCDLAILAFILAFFAKELRSKLLFASGLFIFSFLSVCPGFYFRSHYFIFMLPSFALLASMSIYSLFVIFTKLNLRILGVIIFILVAFFAIAYPIYMQRNYLFLMSPDEITKFVYRTNPFVESVEIAKYIKEETTAEDNIVVIGSEPQIYFYSQRKSATGHIYTYALMEEHDYARTMQNQMIEDIEKNKPKFLIYVHVDTSWLIGPRSDQHILDWAYNYANKYYNNVGLVDINPYEQANFIWGDRIKTYPLKSDYFVLIFKRIN